MPELFKAVGLGLLTILPLANPLTTVALFLGLSGNMSQTERRRQSRKVGFYVFIIMIVSWYAGQLVMNTFGISIPGLRIAGGLIVSFIGFRMLFPPTAMPSNHEETQSSSVAFVPLAMPSTAGPGTIAMIISSAATIKSGVTFPVWVFWVAPPLIYALVGLIVWACLSCSGAVMRFLGKGGIEAISRLMGFLLVCMGVQFLINGILEIINHYPKI